MATALALVHSRFSTNTFPSWDRAHPNRYIAHNGEINTLRGNVNWMHARAGACSNPALFGDDIKKIIPVINTDGSDSAHVRQLRRTARHGGPRTAARDDDDDSRAVGKSREHGRRNAARSTNIIPACMEPWDGPASMAFTDGIRIGACLDRNGLRPSRYYVTKDDLVIMASEAGVLPVAPERVAQQRPFAAGPHVSGGHRAGPHRRGRGAEEEIRHARIRIRNGSTNITSCSKTCRSRRSTPSRSHRKVLQRQQAFGYTFEDLRFIVGPMAHDGVQPLGSMGTDTPLAVLSNKPQLLYNYFKQLVRAGHEPAD